MDESWLLYACGILLTRLVYLPDDERLTPLWSVIQTTTQLLLIAGLFQFGTATIALFVLILLIALASWQWETPLRIQHGMRLITLSLLFISPVAVDWVWGPLTSREMAWVWPDTLILAVFGVLLLANEANYLVRMLFNWCNLVPKLPPVEGVARKVDEDEYRAGRVIGMLERSLIFLIVYYTRDLSAVGFILAAKGLIRIQQLKDRQFSEYMLIGTLASVMCAVVVAFSL